MANICNNSLYFYTEDEGNLKVIKDFFDNWSYDCQPEVEWSDGYSADVYFNSKWTFPEEEMEQLYKDLPNKDDIYMRCLSVEYGNLYHALNICDKNGSWREV